MFNYLPVNKTIDIFKLSLTIATWQRSIAFATNTGLKSEKTILRQCMYIWSEAILMY